MDGSVMRTTYSCVVVGAVAAAIYANSLGGEFVFDDHEAIENNPDVRYTESLINTDTSSSWDNDYYDRGGSSSLLKSA